MSVHLPVSESDVAVSIVVPVRNEADNIAPLIAEIAAALDGRWAYEIIYVNDGSTDATAERLSAEMKVRANLRRIDHEKSTGQSAAARRRVKLRLLRSALDRNPRPRRGVVADPPQEADTCCDRGSP